MAVARSGLEILLDERRDLVRGRRVGLLCHAASVASDLRHAADLVGLCGAELVCLFGPEHGVRGDAQDMVDVESSVDPRLGIPVHSLYGTGLDSLCPVADHVRGLDAVIVDVQDVGSRYYTYVWTMVLVARVCAEARVQLIVLDRVNPLDGIHIEGPSIEPGYTSFVGLHPVPVRHGMTAGEIVRMASAELALDLDLEVVAVQGWRREQLFGATALPWVLPSPNMPTPETALVYPGGCLVEGTNLSEGRGTTRPFEVMGAPWIDGWQLAEALEREDLPGLRLRPTCFLPTFNKHAGTTCGGVQLHVTDADRYRPFLTGVAFLIAARRLWPAMFRWREQPYEFVMDRPAIDLLAGGRWLREAVEQGAALSDLVARWHRDEREFDERRRPHLLYDVD